MENELIGYADDSSLMAVVPSSGVRGTVAETLIRDLGSVGCIFIASTKNSKLIFN